jgi:hypothetical protein
MPAWTRRGLLAAIIGLGFAAQAQAGSATASSWNWWFGGTWRGGISTAPVSATLFPGFGSVSFQPVAAASTSPSIASIVTTSEPNMTPLAVTATQNVAAPTLMPAPAAVSTPTVNGFINLGTGPFADASTIASGSPQAWFNSPQVANLFGGAPTAQQQASFDSAVLQRVQQTFQQSGVPITLTTDPNLHAAHTLSVVSNSTSVPFPNSIGTSTIGGNGFSFIDPIAKSAQSVDQLEWIVAHNVSHELMLTLGVPEKFDQSGNFIDATNANWSMMTSPNATFSPAAADALNQAIQSMNATSGSAQLAQNLDAQAVPEPATLLIWGLGALAVVTAKKKLSA